MKKGIFIDRDGVICKDRNLFYRGNLITKPEDFIWQENAQEGLIELSKKEDYLLFMVTNQSIISKGLLSMDMFHEINKPIYELLESHGRNFSDIYVCPHTSKDICECRKPKIGFINKAKNDFEIDVSKSYIIGDKTSDIKMGIDSGLNTILLMTGYAGFDDIYDVKPNYRLNDLLEAARKIK